jgi:hypothetical protein
VLFKDLNLDFLILNKLEEIDDNIYRAYDCSEQELNLLEYTNKVIIPIVMKHKGNEKYLSPLPHGDIILEGYANLFLSRFKFRLENLENKFVVEIWHTKQVVGMFFKFIPSLEYVSDIVWIDKQNEDVEILSFLTKLGSTKITDKLFVQKDIRGFEKDFFYIFKPNENKLWHKAIGYLDVNEFADAILKEGRKGHNV